MKDDQGNKKKKEIHGLLYCAQPLRPSCPRRWNRDVMAAQNMALIEVHKLQSGDRPAYLRRSGAAADPRFAPKDS